MDYYLINKSQPEARLLIGTDNGFGVFWADQGMSALMNIVDKEPYKLTEVQIKTDQNQSLDITQFLEKIDKLKVRVQNG
jgi:hypothetical protein|tara:strand:- start:33 stop:269 length:237 start_codon:yes stop_codon:yes gene_type:complete